MAYDAFLAAAVARELDGQLAGRSLLGVRPALGTDLLLTFGPRSRPVWVVLATGAKPAVYPLDGEPEGLEPLAGPGLEAFLRLVEARLAGRAVGGVQALAWERIIEFTLLPREGLRGDRESAFLVHEAAPKPARLFLLKGDRTIAAVWPAPSAPPPGEAPPPARPPGERLLRAGEPYQAPATTWTHSPSVLAANDKLFATSLEAASREDLDLADPSRGPAPVWRLLLRVAPPLGPAVARAIARRAGATGSGAGPGLHAAFADAVDAYTSGRFRPCLVLPPEPFALPAEVSALPVEAPSPQTVVACPSASQALAAWHQGSQTAGLRDALAARVGRALRAAVERTRRKVEKQAGDLAKTGEAAALRHSGELLLANLQAVKTGDQQVTVPDYDGPPVTIELDPRLSPGRNAQRYFTRYRKAQRAAQLKGPREKAVHELAWLETVAFDLERLAQPGTGPPAEETPDPPSPLSGVWREVARLRRSVGELLELEAGLARAGYLGAGKGPGAASRRPGGATGGKPGARPGGGSGGRPGAAAARPAREPWRFETDDGLTILAGRTARQNETVSLKLAQPRDLWFHARGCPGSHVLLRLPAGQEDSPPSGAVLQAAALAAHLSAARGGGKVSVDYTEAKHLRRPKGAPPGLVLYDPHRTILVDTGKVSLPRPVAPREG